MSDGSVPPPDQAPVPGWYRDPQGSGLRWWDGNGWTHDLRPDVEPTEAAGGGSNDFLKEHHQPIAVIAVALVLVAIAFASGSGTDLGESGAGAGASGAAAASDADAMNSALMANVAVSTYAVHNGGSFAGVTVEDLVRIEPTLKGAALEASGEKAEYTVAATSTEGGTSFSITGSNKGQTYACSAPGVSECPESGVWAPE